MVQIEEFGADLLSSVGQKRGKRAKLQAFTEVVFKGQVVPATAGGKVILQIVDPNGQVVNSFSLN